MTGYFLVSFFESEGSNKMSLLQLTGKRKNKLKKLKKQTKKHKPEEWQNITIADIYKRYDQKKRQI